MLMSSGALALELQRDLLAVRDSHGWLPVEAISDLHAVGAHVEAADIDACKLHELLHLLFLPRS